MATQQEEVGQEIYTRDHGIVKVDKMSWIDGGYHIVLCPNGTYQHASGLPVRDEKELRAAFGTNKADLERALHWFNNRHDAGENPVRPIGFNSDNVPVFADGTVADFPDLYAFFRPGPILTAAIVALQQYKDKQGPQTHQPKKKEHVKASELAPAAPAPKAKKKSGNKSKTKGRSPAPKTAEAAAAPAS
jgi:hypothetical protein